MDTEGGILGALFAGCLLATFLLSTLVLAAPLIFVAHPIFFNALSVIAAEEVVKATAVVSTKLFFAVITASIEIIRISLRAPYRVGLDALLVLADKPFKLHRPGRPHNLIN